MNRFTSRLPTRDSVSNQLCNFEQCDLPKNTDSTEVLRDEALTQVKDSQRIRKAEADCYNKRVGNDRGDKAQVGDAGAVVRLPEESSYIQAFRAE